MEPAVTVTKSGYGDIVLPIIGQTKIIKYKIDNGFMSVEVINYGATIVAVNLPNSDGINENITLGYDDIVGYLNTKNTYVGATIGRYGHSIACAAFVLKDQTYYLSKNYGQHTHHGGVQGFDKKVWESRIEDSTVVMTYRSYDLEEGFPGDLCVSVRFILTNQNQLIILYKAVPSNMTTPVNIMNQLYFNLGGYASPNVSNHEVKVYSDYKLVLDGNRFPTGETEEVKDGRYDLRKYTTVDYILTRSREADVHPSNNESTAMTEKDDGAGIRIPYSPGGVYYCIEGLGVRPHAKLKCKSSGRAVQIYSDQPCLYLSLGDDLTEAPISRGRRGCNAGILLQTGNFPDAMHHEELPSPWVQPRKIYQHTIVYKFRVSMLDCSDEEDGLPRPPEESEEEARLKCFLVKPDDKKLDEEAVSLST